MIRSYGAIVYVLLFLILAVVVGIVIFPGKASLNRYLYLLEQTKEEKAKAARHRQYREGVRKDLYIAKPGHRKQAILICPMSELTLSHGRGQPEVVENLKKFQCLMQEELYTLSPDGVKLPPQKQGKAMQVVRDFNAMSGKFSYQRQLLTAERDFLTSYTLEGHRLPELKKSAPPTMKGVARSAELEFGSGFKFKAWHLKATFFSAGN